MKEKHLKYGFLDLCPWSPDSLEYDGVNSHNRFIEECGPPPDPTNAEDRARVREERQLQLQYRQERAQAREAEKQRVREEKERAQEVAKQQAREEKQHVREEKQRVREEKEETRKREAWRTQPWAKLSQEQKEVVYAERAYAKLGWSQERRDRDQAWKTAAKLRTERRNLETNRFFCDVCDYNALGNASLNNHFQTQKHQTNQDLVNRGIAVQQTPKGKTDPKRMEKFKEAREKKLYYCFICEYAASTGTMLKDHEKARRHLFRAKEAEKNSQQLDAGPVTDSQAFKHEVPRTGLSAAS